MHWAHSAPPSVALGCFLVAIISGGWFVAPKALAAARRLAPDMNLLMTIAVLGAAGIGEWSEGAAVAFLFGKLSVQFFRSVWSDIFGSAD
jgi:Cd2+/Zn2+-exporting ATPase